MIQDTHTHTHTPVSCILIFIGEFEWGYAHEIANKLKHISKTEFFII